MTDPISTQGEAVRLRKWRCQGCEVVILLTHDVATAGRSLDGAIHAFSRALAPPTPNPGDQQ